MNRKIFMVVLCGVADWPNSILEHKTPLEAAHTPNGDVLAKRGSQAMVTVIDGGICPESDSGIMSLLGYDPHLYYTGRGALEAIGLDFMKPGDNAVGFRVNFASYNEERQRLDRRTARDLSDEELQALVRAVREAPAIAHDVGFESSIAAFGKHRGVVCLKSSKHLLSANVSNTDPGFRKEGPFGVPNKTFVPTPLICTALDNTLAAAFTAEAVNRFATKSSLILHRHEVNATRAARGAQPANILLFRDAGRTVPDLPSFLSRFGRSLSMYGQVPAERGLCKLLGGAWRDARQAQDCPDEIYFRDLVSALISDVADVIVVHLKGPDEPGHDGRPIEKTRVIEKIDEFFTGPLVAGMNPDDILILAADHATPCELGIHSADPVPILITGGSVPKDGTHRYCEQEAQHGDLPVKRAPDLFEYLLTVTE